jgi:hypothetical protein
MKILTLLDKVTEPLYGKRFEKVLHFIVFVFTPIYLGVHVVLHFIKG